MLSAFVATCTAYRPVNTPIEGGEFDMHDFRLACLEDCGAGRAPFYSIAMDPCAFPYGTAIIIPRLNLHFGRWMIGLVCDTGRHFKGLGRTALDICCRYEATETHLIGKQLFDCMAWHSTDADLPAKRQA